MCLSYPIPCSIVPFKSINELTSSSNVERYLPYSFCGLSKGNYGSFLVSSHVVSVPFVPVNQFRQGTFLEPVYYIVEPKILVIKRFVWVFVPHSRAYLKCTVVDVCEFPDHFTNFIWRKAVQI